MNQIDLMVVKYLDEHGKLPFEVQEDPNNENKDIVLFEDDFYISLQKELGDNFEEEFNNYLNNILKEFIEIVENNV